MFEIISCDVLVIGGGAAAIRASIEASRVGVNVGLVDKGKVGESGSSPRALVGFSVRFNVEDSDELFFQDWLRASGNICDQNLVWEAITHSRRAAEELEEMGVKFIRNSDGTWFLSRRAGHSVARGLMVESNGSVHTNIVNVLLQEAEKRGVNFYEDIMITRLLQKNHHISGATGINRKGELFIFSAKAIILAAGGANRLYPNIAGGIEEPRYRTNGDSFSLAFNAGVPLIDMEFAQFRDSPPAGALYGGAYLNALGERFMEKYDPQALEKAPRYLVASAVYREIMAGRGPVVWKAKKGRIEKSRVPLAPVHLRQGPVEITLQFQRLLGGTRINEKAETNTFGLFAAGESSGGIHGGDRMQSNGFLETMVFGANAGRNAAFLALNTKRVDIKSSQLKEEQIRLTQNGGNLDPAEFTQNIQKIMWEQVGVVRDRISLQKAVRKLEQYQNEVAPLLSQTDIFAKLEAINLVLTAEMVSRAALARKETRSSQIRSDYPSTDNNCVKHVCITNQAGKIHLSSLPVATR